MTTSRCKPQKNFTKSEIIIKKLSSTVLQPRINKTVLG